METIIIVISALFYFLIGIVVTLSLYATWEGEKESQKQIETTASGLFVIPEIGLLVLFSVSFIWPILLFMRIWTLYQKKHKMS